MGRDYYLMPRSVATPPTHPPTVAGPTPEGAPTRETVPTPSRFFRALSPQSLLSIPP